MTLLLTTTGQALIPHVLALIFTLGIALILLLFALLTHLKLKGAQKAFEGRFHPFLDQVKALPPLSMDEISSLEALFQEAGYEEAFERLNQESAKHYHKRWWPDLDTALRDEDLLPKALCQGFHNAVDFFAIGLMATALALLFIQTNDLPYHLGLCLLPLATGIAMALRTAKEAKNVKDKAQADAKALRLALTDRIPVYSPHGSMALLIDEMLTHDSAMQASVDQFNETTRHLAESEFSEDLCKAVRTVMHEEVAPPLQQACDRLSDLATHLEQRQRADMDALAGKFATHLAQTIGVHLAPVQKELQLFNQMMQETRHFILDAQAILQSSREQNIALNTELREALGLMQKAKDAMADEMAHITTHMEALSQNSEKLSSAYAGETKSLGAHIASLSTSMDRSLDILTTGLKGSSEAIELAAKLRVDAHDQHQVLTEELGRILDSLQQSSDSLKDSSNAFRLESSAYVNDSLERFDQGLSEVVERLIFTASAIRDAVDALPQALRAPKDL